MRTARTVGVAIMDCSRARKTALRWTVGVEIDYSPASKSALRWAVDNLLDAGDTVVLIHVHSKNADHICKSLFKDTGSPEVSLEEFREGKLSKQYGLDYDDEILEVLDTLSNDKKVKVVANVYWGDPKKKLCNAVEKLSLDSIVVGSCRRCLVQDLQNDQRHSVL